MTESPRASSVWPEMPFMRGPTGAARLREWLPDQRQIRARTAARRERVLRYEWACKRLCQILMIPEARQWNGYVPSAYTDRGEVDHSNPVRRALIELLKDVDAADQAEQELAE